MATRGSADNPGASSFQPYLDMAVTTGFSAMQGPLKIASVKKLTPWFPVLVEFNAEALVREGNETPLQAFVSLRWLQDAHDEFVVVPQVFRNPPPPIASSSTFNFCVLLVRHAEIGRITQSRSWSSVIIKADMGPPILLPAKGVVLAGVRPPLLDADNPQKQEAASSRPDRVVIGVIDQGIAFANSRFRDSAGSRIDWLWQQDLSGTGTPLFPGKELSAATIDAAITAAHEDEDTVYRQSGGLDYSEDGYKALGRRSSHGTHVLDLAANDQLQTCPRNQHPLIVVDMPDDAVSDPSGSTLTAHATLGLIYILARAESIRKSSECLPVVANISYGPYEGPHDGTATFELFMDLLTMICSGSSTPLQIVLAAGNSRQSRTHAAFPLNPGYLIDLDWRLQPGSAAPSYMEIWLPAAKNTNIEVTLTSPLGQQCKVDMTTGNVGFPNTGPLLMSLAYSKAGAMRDHVLLYVTPTSYEAAASAGLAPAPSGVWTVRIKNLASQALTIDAWIKRSDTPAGRRMHGRQSRFEDIHYDQLDRGGRPQPYEPSPPMVPPPPQNRRYTVRRGTLSGIATGRRTIVVGSSILTTMAPATYSAQGGQHGSAPPARPRWLAASEDSPFLAGRLAAGTRSGSWVAMGGSSAAAPQSTRAFATTWIGQQNPPATLQGLKPATFPPSVPPTERLDIAGGGVAPSTPRRGRPAP